MARGNFGGGDGTELNPFLVEDKEDLLQVFYKNREYPMHHYKQSKDINLIGVDWIPIGDISQGPPFMGVFDGDNYSIKNLKFSSGSSYIGLFGLCVGATLKNIDLEKAEIVSSNGFYAALLCAYLDGQCVVSDCSVQGTVVGNFSNSNIAGLAVSLSSASVIERCSANVKLIGHYLAGAVVYANGTISNCCIVGSIEGASLNGEAKLQASTFANSCDSSCIIRNSYSVVTINNANTRNSSMGLFASPASPYETPTIESCFSDITVGVTTDGWHAGIPYYSSSSEFYVRGTDSGLYKLINNQDGIDYSGLPPYGTFYNAQPIAGARYSEFWEPVTSSTSMQGRETKEMKTKANYVGWDFGKVWLISEDKTYPILRKPPRKITCKRVPLTNYRR